MPARRHVIHLFDNLRIATTGVTGAGAVYTYIDLNVRALLPLLLQTEDMFLVTLQVGGPDSNELEWNVELIPGYDRDHENAAVALASSDINADGTVRQAPYTTGSSFLPHGRLRIRYKNKNSVSGVKTAVISAILVVQTLAQ